MPSLNDIRTAFLDFFAAEGHEVVPSSPLVPRNDPTLMFTNAGMVQFKDYFTGRTKAPFPRAVTAQKCVRAGGKHNDLDNVGYTARHHTFFEMLGNFSFGDYFKERAIELAWRLVTEEFGLAPERLMATVFAADDDAYELWRKVAGLPESRIIRIASSDNFWAMGDTGPCGPCSEIFYDHGEHIPGGPPGSADEDGDRFVEIWNLVFMQYEQLTPESRVELPRPSIDTGMGLERIAAVMQGTHDNYRTDLFRTLIAAIEEAIGASSDGGASASHRVIADHLRATSFLIADGVLPSNEGRGYVLRRIMRRAMRHAHMLGAGEPAIWRTVPVLAREMGQAYPELGRAQSLIAETLKLEESRFQKTLARGLALLEEATAGLGPGAMLDGETAFRLYDTYGFPLDLTQDALKPRGIHVDLGGFADAMERQRTEARASWAGSGEAATEAVWHGLRERHRATDFLGYDTESAEAVVQALVKNGAEAPALGEDESGAIVVNQTPFYGEAGGQVGDTGLIESADGQARFRVEDTQRKADGLIVHLGRMEAGRLSAETPVRMLVDGTRRSAIRKNHSATHLVHAALRRTLGSHVTQKGSLVAPGRLRFDFSHPKPLAPEELQAVDDLANAVVLADAPVETHLMERDEAIASGAMALFGEKYGEEVRVVSMGADPAGGDRQRYSLELCGGTHVGRTGEIGLIAVVAESAVAAGVRRLEALTGEAARHYLEAQDRRLREVAAALKVRPEDAPERVQALVEERRRLERELAEARKKLALGGGGAAEPAMRQIGRLKLMARAVEGVAPKDLRGLVDQGKRQVGSGVVAIVGINDGKAGLVVGVTDDLTETISAVELARLGSAALGGTGGGGRPDLAQAGGPDPSRAEAALKAIASRVEELAA
jgi:alanyl-tRNA synthetase